MERRGNLGRPFLMVYYEETKLINNWQLNRVLALSSARGSFSGERRENGELKNRGREGGGLNFSSPHSPAYRKDERELCGGESPFSAFLVQQQNIPLYFFFFLRLFPICLSHRSRHLTSQKALRLEIHISLGVNSVTGCKVA